MELTQTQKNFLKFVKCKTGLTMSDLDLRYTEVLTRELGSDIVHHVRFEDMKTSEDVKNLCDVIIFAKTGKIHTFAIR